jgi:hypothetical protein
LDKGKHSSVFLNRFFHKSRVVLEFGWIFTQQLRNMFVQLNAFGAVVFGSGARDEGSRNRGSLVRFSFTVRSFPGVLDHRLPRLGGAYYFGTLAEVFLVNTALQARFCRERLVSVFCVLYKDGRVSVSVIRRCTSSHCALAIHTGSKAGKENGVLHHWVWGLKAVSTRRYFKKPKDT